MQDGAVLKRDVIKMIIITEFHVFVFCESIFSVHIITHLVQLTCLGCYFEM